MKRLDDVGHNRIGVTPKIPNPEGGKCIKATQEHEACSLRSFVTETSGPLTIQNKQINNNNTTWHDTTLAPTVRHSLT